MPVAKIDGEQMSAEEYMRSTLRLCLEKRPRQLPATAAAVAYADQCRAKLAELDAAIAAEDTDAVRAVLDWSQGTHAEFAALRAGG